MAGEATHHWIMVLDVENFSSRRDPVQRRVRAAMYRALSGAMERAGLAAADTVTEDRGDGVLMLVSPAVPPVLLAGPFVTELDTELGVHAEQSNEEHALRLRLALHQGLAAPDEHGWSGDAVNTACRLVDAQPLRDVLSAAPSARMVFAVSDEVYRGVIGHGHRGIDPAAYLPCAFTTKHGERIDSWITVPGRPAPPGLPPESAASAASGSAEGDQDAPGRPTVVQHARTVQGDQIAGDKHVSVHTTGSVRL
ncbi:hypothetical protein NGF19_14500 [Streptomyces sp. RY43-2]|uniref:Guanylate cyclase domain-containing protein n=1 Tax=Streptomyces macrolidinus TaxID=2952607 RepID=A0ABT0ZEJ4_9ACTN|nr:hypothetical protein [Streptomyces macrolidinus]MCN9241987.1 hypothetical protein [Streptomyces macrolidinus]